MEKEYCKYIHITARKHADVSRMADGFIEFIIIYLFVYLLFILLFIIHLSIIIIECIIYLLCIPYF